MEADYFEQNMSTLNVTDPNLANLLYDFRHIPIRLANEWGSAASIVFNWGGKVIVEIVINISPSSALKTPIDIQTALLHELGHSIDLKNEGTWKYHRLGAVNGEKRANKHAIRLARKYGLDINFGFLNWALYTQYGKHMKSLIKLAKAA